MKNEIKKALEDDKVYKMTFSTNLGERSIVIYNEIGEGEEYVLLTVENKIKKVGYEKRFFYKDYDDVDSLIDDVCEGDLM